MKTIIITVVISAFAFSVNAQQSPLLPRQEPLKNFRFTPDSLARNSFLFKQNPLQTFRFSPDNLNSNNFSFKQADSLRAKPVTSVNITANINIDNMPIARMQGYSNMPVGQTDRTGYNMPVVGLQGNSKKQAVQADGIPYNMPFFGGKAPVYFEFKKYPNDTPPADNTRK